jgi:hypothetical protein
MSIVQQSISSLLDAWIASEQKGDRFPVPFDIAWGLAGYSTKASAKRALKDVEASHVSTQMLNKPSSNASGFTQFESITLSIDGLKDFCLLAKTEEGRNIRKYFVQAEKELRQLKLEREYPKQITGEIAINPTKDLLEKVNIAIDTFFPHIDIEIRTGMKIEAACNVDPSLKPILEQHKPKILLESPLLSPTEIGKLLEAADGIKRSAQAVNKLLVEKNLQVATGDKKLAYKPIGQGIEFSKLVADTASGHGKTIQHLRWYESVCSLLLAD